MAAAATSTMAGTGEVRAYTRTGELEGVVAVGQGPTQIAVSGDGRVPVVANRQGGIGVSARPGPARRGAPRRPGRCRVPARSRPRPHRRVRLCDLGRAGWASPAVWPRSAPAPARSRGGARPASSRSEWRTCRAGVSGRSRRHRLPTRVEKPVGRRAGLPCVALPSVSCGDGRRRLSRQCLAILRRGIPQRHETPVQRSVPVGPSHDWR